MASGTFYPVVTGDDGMFFGSTFAANNEYNSFGKKVAVSCNTFLRFPSVAIAAGSTITTAILTMVPFSDRTNTVCNVNCYFNDVDNAVAPTTYSEGDGLSLTSAVAWDAIPALTAWTPYDAPELKTILQNVIDRGGWATGQAVMVVLKDNGSDDAAERDAVSIKRSGGIYKAELYVEWTETPATSGIFYPAVAADDGFVSGTTLHNSYTYAEIGNAGNVMDNAAFTRFLSVSIPQGSTITSAFVRFLAWDTHTDSPVNVNCHFEAADNATQIASGADYQGRTLTSPVAWDGVVGWTDETNYDSPSIVSILQDIVDRPGWSTGNAVLFSVENNGTAFANYRYFYTIEKVTVPIGGAELHVTWGPPESVDEVASWNPYDTGSNITFDSTLLTATHA